MMEAEFDCAECGDHVFAFGHGRSLALCVSCLHMPGWFMNAELRRMLHYEGDAHWTMGDEYERSG